MHTFKHITPPIRLYAGQDALISLTSELARCGIKQPLVLCGQSVASNGALERVFSQLEKFDAASFCHLKSNSPTTSVEAATKTAQTHKADGLIAIGGGSAMVSARAVAIKLAENADWSDICTRQDPDGRTISPRLNAAKLPIFAIPTTPTTAIVKVGTAVFDEKNARRLALFDPKTRVQSIFIDPNILETTPPDLVQTATLNTLCSALEAISAGGDDHLARSQLVYAASLCSDPASSRSDLVQAAILCGLGTDHTRNGLATSLSHSIGLCTDINPAIAKAATLPHVVRFNWDFIECGRRDLAKALDCDEHDVIFRLMNLFQGFGVPPKLRDLGIKAREISKIAEHTFNDWFTKTNPRPIPDQSTLCDVIEHAW